MEELYFEPTLRLLICKVHGYGVHPEAQAIIRHLRGEGHRFRGTKLKDVVVEVLRLPLASTEELSVTHLPLSGKPSALAIPHLQLLAGFQCSRVDCTFLTTSFELIQRHVRKCQAEGSQPLVLWEPCYLQTIFQETKFRRYFIVSNAVPDGECAYDSPPGQQPSSKAWWCAGSKRTRIELGPKSLTRRTSFEAPIPSLTVFHPVALLASQYC